MLELSKDPQTARQQMNGLIIYLTTFAYADGDFAPSEIEMIREMIGRIVRHRVQSSESGYDPEVSEELVRNVVSELEAVLDSAMGEVSRLLQESVAEAERQRTFVESRLKQRCFEVFQSFDEETQEELIAAADELLMADGQVHPAEVELRNELSGLLRSRSDIRLEPMGYQRRAEVRLVQLPLPAEAEHPLFREIEQLYSEDPARRASQVEADRSLIRSALGILERQRARGAGRLAERRTVEDIPPGEPFLDEFVYALPPRPGKKYELTVVGDLHGCYSNAKAIVLQSRFLERMAAYQRDPEGRAEPRLLFLGDYLDRGRFSFEGVLRLALQLFTSFPDNVCLLRGNHEMFLDHEGKIVSAVHPAEGIERLRAVAPPDLVYEHMGLFNALPSMLLCGRALFVHGGVPRDAVVAEKVRGLAGLNDWEVRFQMMWSDPSVVDVIPRPLQEATYRFGFGRLQCQNFLKRIGCNVLVRGHEHVLTGFWANYDDDHLLATTVLSAGGAGNEDVPETSDFRLTRPMALTVRSAGELDSNVDIEVWPIDFAALNDPERNRFYRER